MKLSRLRRSLVLSDEGFLAMKARLSSKGDAASSRCIKSTAC